MTVLIITYGLGEKGGWGGGGKTSWYVLLDSPRELSWAQDANAAARRVMRFLSELSTSRASRRHITSSTEGCERMARSEPSSWGPAYVTMGYTVNLQPQPFTEPSLVNFQRNSSPASKKTIIHQWIILLNIKQDRIQKLSSRIPLNCYRSSNYWVSKIKMWKHFWSKMFL